MRRQVARGLRPRNALFRLGRGTRHLALGAGPLTLVVVFSLWWLRRPCRPWWLSRAGGTLLVRVGPLEVVWWVPGAFRGRSTRRP